MVGAFFGGWGRTNIILDHGSRLCPIDVCADEQGDQDEDVNNDIVHPGSLRALVGHPWLVISFWGEVLANSQTDVSQSEYCAGLTVR